MEIWKPIPGFSRYMASDYGQLKSLNYKNSKKEKILKPGLSPDGYMKTMLLSDENKYCSWGVHKFITLAFIGMETGKEVNHIDGVKTNNSLSNLELVTRSQNVKHAFKLGLAKPARGEKNGMAKITDAQAQEIKDYVLNARKNGIRYYGREELAKKYGLQSASIKDIMRRLCK